MPATRQPSELTPPELAAIGAALGSGVLRRRICEEHRITSQGLTAVERHPDVVAARRQTIQEVRDRVVELAIADPLRRVAQLEELNEMLSDLIDQRTNRGRYPERIFSGEKGAFCGRIAALRMQIHEAARAELDQASDTVVVMDDADYRAKRAELHSRLAALAAGRRADASRAGDSEK